MLHSRVLRYIDEVARSGSIRAAGERLNVAASAINKHVLQLEEAIGEPLFERLPRGLRLTPAGEILLAHVRRTMREYSQVEAEIRDLKALQGGEVIVATMNGLAGGIVPKAAALFCARHPRIRISIKVMFLRDIVGAVEAGEADLGLAFNLPRLAQLDCLGSVDARLGAVVSSAHPLSDMDSISLASCLPYPLIFPDRSMVMHDLVAETFAAADLPAEPTFLTNSIEAMKHLAATGNSIAFLSKFDVAEELRAGVLTYLPIRDRPFGQNVLTLVQRDRRSRGLAVQMFADELLRSLKLSSDPNGASAGC
ncbi:MAG: LysR family transcriptional regulator [Pannonibacter sp.]